MPTSPSKALGAVEIFCEQMGAQAGDEMRLDPRRPERNLLGQAERAGAGGRLSLSLRRQTPH